MGNLTASFECDDENLVHIKLVDKHLIHTCLIMPDWHLSIRSSHLYISLWFILLLLVIIMCIIYMHYLPHRKQSIPVSRVFTIISTKKGESRCHLQNMYGRCKQNLQYIYKLSMHIDTRIVRYFGVIIYLLKCSLHHSSFVLFIHHRD